MYRRRGIDVRFFHTADWHLGKLVQGIHMTEDQRYVLLDFVEAIKEEKPDAVIIAGDLYDRAVPPTEAVYLLDDILHKIVIELGIPVLAVAGNHDSPSRLNFGSKIMKNNGLHIVGRLNKMQSPVILDDEHGEVHFHLVPYVDPSVVRNVLEDDEIQTHNDAAGKIVKQIESTIDPSARHVYIGHAFVTPHGIKEANTSDSERPLSIGGAEYVSSDHFLNFNYTALGHLHQGHYVSSEKIRYSGSLLKFSISEEHHKKGYNIVEMDESGGVTIEKRLFEPRRDMRTVEGSLEEILTHEINEDYVFIRLTDKTPILSPMDKVRSVYPNAMHIERTNYILPSELHNQIKTSQRNQLSQEELFISFYEEVKGIKPDAETEAIFKEVLEDILKDDNESSEEKK